MAIELSDDLLALERVAWREMQAGALTVDTAWAVLSAVAAHAEAAGVNRYELEMALKARVRTGE
ncbi:hypothetical protein V1460_27640 [Streptomyces sp. SCSIO 30461]|uniref:hypothetical protein n=1 Tax=Streptomyces sp. SCSIO 30461 TaxID=3118085 RepID=UPI0030D4E0F4